MSAPNASEGPGHSATFSKRLLAAVGPQAEEEAGTEEAWAREYRELLSCLPKPHEVVFSGWLIKLGRLHKNWKRRFMVLKGDGFLYYYKKGPARGEAVETACARKHKGRLSMAECLEVMSWDAVQFMVNQRERNLGATQKLLQAIKFPPNSGRDTAFGVRTLNRTWVFCALKGATVADWVAAINAQCSQQWKVAAMTRRASLPASSFRRNSPGLATGPRPAADAAVARQPGPHPLRGEHGRATTMASQHGSRGAAAELEHETAAATRPKGRSPQQALAGGSKSAPSSTRRHRVRDDAGAAAGDGAGVAPADWRGLDALSGSDVSEDGWESSDDEARTPHEGNGAREAAGPPAEANGPAALSVISELPPPPPMPQPVEGVAAPPPPRLHPNNPFFDAVTEGLPDVF